MYDILSPALHFSSIASCYDKCYDCTATKLGIMQLFFYQSEGKQTNAEVASYYNGSDVILWVK